MTPADVATLIRDRTVELAAVPAPPFHEARRAGIVAGWWHRDGLAPHIDQVGNVRAQLRAGSGPATLICAHLDTVFDLDLPHDIRIDDHRMHGPGVGDNTVAVASLSALTGLLPPHTPRPVWIAATVGEEGLGNLAGVRHLLQAPFEPLGEVIALEGNYLGRVGHIGVGSVRWTVRLEGPGGHAWEAADMPSAIHVLGRTIAALDRLRHPSQHRWTLNVGQLRGGEAINARARAAEMTIDLRAEDPHLLDQLSDEVLGVIGSETAGAIESQVIETGRRPAGRIPHDHALVTAACQALRSIGREPRLVASSTDANAAHSHGITAIALGITTGAGEHTPDEWIDLEPIADGVAALAATVLTAQQGTPE